MRFRNDVHKKNQFHFVIKDILVVIIVLFYCTPLADMLVTSSIILRVYQIPYISFILNTFIIFFYDEMVLFFFHEQLNTIAKPHVKRLW